MHETILKGIASYVHDVQGSANKISWEVQIRFFLLVAAWLNVCIIRAVAFLLAAQ